MTKGKWINKWLAFLGITVTAATCFAQGSFDYKANLDAVKQDGFYKILLSPSIIGKCQDGLRDIRIMDDKQKQVSYLIKQDEPQFVKSSFIEFPIISKKREKDKQVHVVIENKDAIAVNDLLLILANTSTYRTINISGSNDLKDWYIIKEKASLDVVFKPQKKEYVQNISLPMVDYKYLQITFVGEHELPANIIRAGIYKEQYLQNRYLEIPAPTIRQEEKEGNSTFVYLNFDEPYLINKIDLDIEGPKYYLRSLSLEQEMYSTFPYMVSIGTNNNTLYFGQFKRKEVVFSIANKDNAPLKFKAAKAYQLNTYMLAYLEKGKPYHLAFGDSLASAPEYDLKYFKDSIGTDIPVLGVGKVETINTLKPVTSTQKNNNKGFLWITIAIVSTLLLFFTLKMTREIKKRNTDAHL